MRVSIKGVPIIPKELWSNKAHMHREFSEDLSLLLSADKSGPLADALRKMIEKNKRLAEVCDELEKETKKGRPTKKLTKHDNKLMVLLHPNLYELRRLPGRPTQNGPAFDKLAFEFVEERRKELAQANKSKPTIEAAIKSVIAEWARENSKRETTNVRKKFASMNSAYQRGKKLSVA